MKNNSKFLVKKVRDVCLEMNLFEKFFEVEVIVMLFSNVSIYYISRCIN